MLVHLKAAACWRDSAPNIKDDFLVSPNINSSNKYSMDYTLIFEAVERVCCNLEQINFIVQINFL